MSDRDYKLTSEDLGTFKLKNESSEEVASYNFEEKIKKQRSRAKENLATHAAERTAQKAFDKTLLGKAKKATFATFGAIGTVLSLGENAVVYTGRMAFYQDKSTVPSFTENTFHDFMIKDVGMEDNMTTALISLAPSIFLDPLTYLSAGVGTIGKLSKLRSIEKTGLLAKRASLLDSAKRAGRLIDKSTDTGRISKLTKAQKTILDKVKSVEGSIDQIADMSLSKTGNAMLAKKTQDKINKKLTGKTFKSAEARAGAAEGLYPQAFKESTEELISLVKSDSAAYKKVVDAGGLKWGVGSHKVTLLTGAQVNDMAKASGVARALQFAGNTPFGESTVKTLKYFRDKFVTKKAKGVARYAEEDAAQIANVLGDLNLDLKKGIDIIQKDVKHMFRNLSNDESVVLGRGLLKVQRIEEAGAVVKEALPDLLKSDISNHFSKIIKDKGLTGVAKDKMLARAKEVKKVADEWVETVAKLAKKGDVPEAEILKMYYPHFYKHKMPKIGGTLTLQQAYTPAQKEWLLQRKLDGFGAIDNPGHALALRNITMLQADLQDKAYAAVAKQFGVKFASKKAARESNYVSLSSFSKAANDDIVGMTVNKAAMENVYVPKHIFDRVSAEMGTKAVHIPIWSNYTKLWKRSVTAPFAGFHVRNYMSNIVLNSMKIGGQAINPKLHKMGLDVLFSKSAKSLDNIFYTADGFPLTIRKLREEMKKFKVVDGNNQWDDIVGGMTKDLNPAEKGIMRHLITRKLNPFSQHSIGVDFGSKIEDQARAVNYLSWRMKGIRPDMAAAASKQALFDYGDLTKAERFFKEAIPFYTFASKNAKMQLHALATRPGVWAAQVKLLNTVGPTDEQFARMPEWVQDKISFSAFGRVIVPGILPLEAFTELVDKETMLPDMKAIGSMMNPLFKYFLEKGSGTDFRTERPIDNLNRADEFKPIIDLAEWTGDVGIPDSINLAKAAVKFLKLEKHANGSVTADPSKLHVSRSLFTSRMQATWKTMNSEEKTLAQKTMQLTFGINAVDLDSKSRLYYNQRNLYKKEVQDELMKRGKAKERIIFVGAKGTMGKAMNKRVNRLLRKHMDEISRASEAGRPKSKKWRKEKLQELLKTTKLDKKK